MDGTDADADGFGWERLSPCTSLLHALDPRYNALQYNAYSVITRLRSWTLTYQSSLARRKGHGGCK